MQRYGLFNEMQNGKLTLEGLTFRKRCTFAGWIAYVILHKKGRIIPGT